MTSRDPLDSLCPACHHVLMWSTGRLRRPIFRRWRKKLAKVKYWYCDVGFGENWSVGKCDCRNAAHNLEKV